ncbi:hypothetical protein XELAEV_18033472mg [Xenopus laevis]|uniref:Uncharacterized protein n=1 Tax=Xenopus laevis TaxID=8355 RepID=A0A974HE18_XENLA|nr:hypothetical protein XELAEV_18033472mg [Xenopus laevis]
MGIFGSSSRSRERVEQYDTWTPFSRWGCAGMLALIMFFILFPWLFFPLFHNATNHNNTPVGEHPSFPRNRTPQSVGTTGRQDWGPPPKDYSYPPWSKPLDITIIEGTTTTVEFDACEFSVIP